MDAVRTDWRTAALDARTIGMLTFAEMLTKTPAACSSTDVDDLRKVGLGDKEVLALVMLVGFFNLATRVADGLGVQLDAHLTRGTAEYVSFLERTE